MPALARVVYLHGFASSPRSTKAAFFRERLSRLGFAVEVPDLAAGKFFDLTLTGELERLGAVLSGEPAILIGSSLGGYLAALYAAAHPEIEKLVLLAPAFGFHQLWLESLGSTRVAQWREKGSLPVFHYGEGRELLLSYRFLEDAAGYSPFPDTTQPALIFHGSADGIVPLAQSIAFSRLHTEARLVEIASGHELTDVLEVVWLESRDFLLGESRTG